MSVCLFIFRETAIVCSDHYHLKRAGKYIYSYWIGWRGEVRESDASDNKSDASDSCCTTTHDGSTYIVIGLVGGGK